LLTPLAPGAIAVIAIRGPETGAVLSRILRAARSDRHAVLKDGTPALVRIVDGDRVVDDAIVVTFRRDGARYAEINTHGGVRIVQQVLMLLEKAGAAIVDAGREIGSPGVPTDLDRRFDEVLIHAASCRVARWLLAQRDILPSYLHGINQVSSAERRAFEVRSTAARRLIRGIQIAIIGPPNAGKSTLANRLIGHDRVITSDVPGTTRDWISETAMIDGWPVTLTDTAGIRSTECLIESEAIRRGRERAGAADLILLVVEGALRAEVLIEQVSEVRSQTSSAQPMIVVCNKSDRRNDATWITTLTPIATCEISALNGTGISALEAMVSEQLGLDLLTEDQPAAFFPTELADAP